VFVHRTTGRNFGAGMSGGIAYVHDPAKVFPTRLNREMVDLDPLEDEDREFLRDAIRRHHEETGSTVAEGILSRWRREVEHFAKVMPKDYKRVLDAARIAEERGVSVDEAIMAASHG
jgi:glutamate synthase (NADPH/NADH) large chain